MKNNNIIDEIEKAEKSQDIISTIIGVSINLIIFSIILGLLYFAVKYITLTKDTPTTKPINIVTTGSIIDVYKKAEDNGNSKVVKYYIMVNTEGYGAYIIKVSKGDFMKYKIDDTVAIRINNNKAILVE